MGFKGIQMWGQLFLCPWTQLSNSQDSRAGKKFDQTPSLYRSGDHVPEKLSHTAMTKSNLNPDLSFCLFLNSILVLKVWCHWPKPSVLSEQPLSSWHFTWGQVRGTQIGICAQWGDYPLCIPLGCSHRGQAQSPCRRCSENQRCDSQQVWLSGVATAAPQTLFQPEQKSFSSLGLLHAPFTE